jgi:secreted PhoX family phosphatase
MNTLNRRHFLKFLGQSSILISAPSSLFLSSCSTSSKSTTWKAILPDSSDELILAKGLNYKLLAKWGDVIAQRNQQNIVFGMHNDFTSFIAFDSEEPNEGFLLVNHEYLNTLFLTGWTEKQNKSKTKEQVDAEIKSVGVSILHIKKTGENWHLVQDSEHNYRIDGHTPIEIIAEHPIAGTKMSYGTLANCAGGQTPWKTFLTCEENYDMFYGELDFSPKPGRLKPRKNAIVRYHEKDLGWYNQYDRSPLHYGWVVEINPANKSAKKLTALGRFAHEGATCVVARDGRTVVYMGDDANNQCIYKFISEKPNSIEKGTLYVANTKKGVWLPLKMNSHPSFKTRFANQTDLLVNTREAAATLGGTPQDRPEDIEINPSNGDIIVALTNNKAAQRPHGSLLKITEKNSDYLSMEFKSETWISGGDDNLLSCPDNMAFDPAGNLWVTSDRADGDMNQGVYKKFKNNGLYYIPMKGPDAGQIFQIASAPKDAEFTGPTFLPDGTLVLCVQHPGEQTRDLKQLTSNWPGQKNEVPRSAVVTIQGSLLTQLISR